MTDNLTINLKLQWPFRCKQQHRGDGGELGDAGEDHGAEQRAEGEGEQDGGADGRSGGRNQQSQCQN